MKEFSTDYSPDYVDSDCSTGIQTIGQIVSDSSLEGFEQDARRAYDIVTWILRKRYQRIIELEDILAKHAFSEAHLKYKNMISVLGN